MHNHYVRKLCEKLDNLKISDYHGLSSPGLTCYLNSVLQVLFMTEDFREAVKRSSSDQPHSPMLDPYLCELFIHLEREEANASNIASKLGIKDVFKQRDAAEYFEKILCLTGPQSSTVFKGELNHRTTCHGCKNKSDSKNFFWVLPLAVENSNHKTFNVQQGLDSFFEVQTVSADNKIYCNMCNKKQDGATECKMTQSPDILTLLLKRFTFDYRKNYYVKLKCKADVTQTVHIQKYRYDLYAVVHHFGDLSGGHYTADIKSFETGQWYCFDDRIVKRVKPQYFEGEGNVLRYSVLIDVFDICSDHAPNLTLPNLLQHMLPPPITQVSHSLSTHVQERRPERTDSSDLKTHRTLSGLMDKERRDKAAAESCRGENKTHSSSEPSRINQTSSRRARDQLSTHRTSPMSILPPAVTGANRQDSGTKRHTPEAVHSSSPSLRRRSSKAKESTKSSGSPGRHRKSSSLDANMKPVTADKAVRPTQKCWKV